MNDQVPEAIPQPNFTMPVSGPFLDCLIRNFCQKPVKGIDIYPECSIGVAEESLVATDGRSAILVGKPASEHVSTQRKEALIEAFRAKEYGDPARINAIPRNTGDGGEVLKMVDVQGVIRTQLNGMRSVATFSPDAIVAIGKAAQAAGAFEVELYQPEGDANVLGFRFSAEVPYEFQSLFSEWSMPIESMGVFTVRKSDKQNAPSLPEVGEDKPQKPLRERAKAVAPSIIADIEQTQETEIIDVTELVAVSEEVTDEERTRGEFTLPALSLLAKSEHDESAPRGEYASQIMAELKEFGVQATLQGYQRGPSITQYRIELGRRVKPKAVTDLNAQLQMRLAVSSLRIEAPIPGANAVGIEVPNKVRDAVNLRDLVSLKSFWESSPLVAPLGVDVSGRPVYGDIGTMPHCLIAGSTGAGKSIGLSAILTSLLMRNTPEDVRLVLIDPKRVELGIFNEVPHLLCPVITDVKEAPGVLMAVRSEMDRRYDLLRDAGVRNIDDYNAKHPETKLARIVVVIDELADLMLQARQDVEGSISRIGALARASGIHLIVATQRPSVDVISGTIKNNIPTRIAFMVTSQVDSRTVIDMPGAESLLGRGDMLFVPIGAAKPIRVQGTFVSTGEIEAVVEHWKSQARPSYAFDPAEFEGVESVMAPSSDQIDPMWGEVVRYSVETGQVSTSMIQRKFRLGFQRASLLLDTMEKKGVIGAKDGPRPRTVLITVDQVEEYI
jgi:DNA segregation ATPase FtsK/SpoIIIE-like protein